MPFNLVPESESEAIPWQIFLGKLTHLFLFGLLICFSPQPAFSAEEAAAELNNNSVTRVGGVTSAKLFVGNGRIPEDTPWLHMELNDADQFIRRRMQTYSDRKTRDRLFFSGDLIQYLAWKSGVRDSSDGR